MKKHTNQTTTTCNPIALTLIISMSVALTACGGDSSSKVKTEYDRIEGQVSDLSDDIKDDYNKFEDKLTDDEKSMSSILQSIFLPSDIDEQFDEFVDKLTPHGGKGGLYVGHFVEVDDGDNSDIDIGAIYFDITDDFGGSIDGRVSYQQNSCQVNRTLATSSSIKVDENITGKLSGSLDTLEFMDVKFIRDLDIETPNLLTTFVGDFSNDSDNSKSTWSGRFEYQDGLGGKELSSGEDNCNVSYTIAKQSDYTTYPLNYSLGTLDLAFVGTGSRTTLKWNTVPDAQLILVSQINVNKAKVGANGFIVNQVLANNQNSITPIVTDTPTNYAFVVQAFNSNNELLAFDALIMDLPKGSN